MQRWSRVRLLERDYAPPWTKYFEAIKDMLGEVGREPLLVLLDPDTGLRAGSSAKKHMGTADLNLLWKAAGVGDVFLLFQNSLRKKNWVEHVSRVITEHADIPATAIECHPGSGICMYEIRK